MGDDIKTYVSEILDITGETYKGLCIAAGHISGLFNLLRVDSSITVADMAKQKDYDVEKVRRWVHFAAGIDIVKVDPGERVTLTTKGLLLTTASPVKDVLAFVDGLQFLIKATDQAELTFRKGQSFDKLSDGKVSRDYQPRVSDNFSAALIDHIKKFSIQDTDVLFDVGCGNGSFLRSACKALPNNRFVGMDLNLFAIEKAKRENLALGLTERIKMLVGDMVEDLDEIPDNTYDWVTAVNILHFVPVDMRDAVIRNIVRIARKGAFFNLCTTDSNMIALTANCLMSILWNDFTGFYTDSEAEKFFSELPLQYRNLEIRSTDMMQGTSKLVSLLK